MREALASALAELSRRDERAADMARSALSTLSPDLDLQRLNQHAVQRFCWYELPLRFQNSPEDRLFAVRSLGHLFQLLQLFRYGNVCSSPETTDLLQLYERDHTAGLAMYERLMWESGWSRRTWPN